MAMDIKEKLKALRSNKGLTQQQVADELGVSQVTYARYESGRREPDKNMTLALAIFFKCTTDYLLGITDEPNLVQYILPNSKIEGEQVAINIVQDAIKDGLTPDEIKMFLDLARKMKQENNKD